MQKIAIISDIEGNIEALEAVIEDIQKNNVSTIYCLGDIVGFAGSPKKCLQTILETCEIILQGFYDSLLFSDLRGMREDFVLGFLWIKSQIKTDFFRKSPKYKQSSFHAEDNCLFVHASPRDPLCEYILASDVEDLFEEIPPKIQEIFALIDSFCFAGHNHRAGLITEKSEWIYPTSCDNHFSFSPHQKYIISVGSVGLPIDGDWRACYVIFDGQECRWYRVEYDVEKTISKIQHNSHYPSMLKDRLLTNLNSGMRWIP